MDWTVVERSSIARPAGFTTRRLEFVCRLAHRHHAHRKERSLHGPADRLDGDPRVGGSHRPAATQRQKTRRRDGCCTGSFGRRPDRTRSLLDKIELLFELRRSGILSQGVRSGSGFIVPQRFERTGVPWRASTSSHCTRHNSHNRVHLAEPESNRRGGDARPVATRPGVEK